MRQIVGFTALGKPEKPRFGKENSAFLESIVKGKSVVLSHMISHEL